METFRAAVLHGLGSPLAIEQVERTELAPGDVLIRNRASGLCHTDLEVIDGSLAYPLPIVLGTAVEGTSALIILTPIFVPILVKLHVDPVHFGIVLVTNLTIAGVTPPVGQMMFISSQVMRVPMEDYTIEVLPFLAAMLVVLLLLTLFPQITLWLPNYVYGMAAG